MLTNWYIPMPPSPLPFLAKGLNLNGIALMTRSKRQKANDLDRKIVINQGLLADFTALFASFDIILVCSSIGSGG
jgi:hypothetical protein